MATRTLWQDLFAINVSSNLNGNSFSGVGITNTKKLVGLTESVFFKEPSGYYEYAQTTGKSYRTFNEYTQTYQGEPVEYSMGVQCNAHSLSLFQTLLFQGGCTETGAAGINKMVSVPYTAADPSYYAEFVRAMQDTSASGTIDEMVTGGICTSLTISGEKGATVQLEATMQGGSFTQADYSDTVQIAGGGGFDTVLPFKFQNAKAHIFNTTASAPHGTNDLITIPSFSVTVSQTPTWAFYNDTKASNVALGPLEVSGSISFPWGDANYGENSAINDFINGQAKQLWLYWGETAGAAAGSCLIKMHAYITDYSIGGDNELMVEATLTGIADAAGSTYPIEIMTSYDTTVLDRTS
tara:strand:+ start:121 stop:1179 length:1059 start_codon:yes stop_codon:yes gene_type:complete